MGTSGEMKGAAMKLGQMASFIDIESLAPSTARFIRSSSRSCAPTLPRCPGKGSSRCSSLEHKGVPLRELFTDIEREAFATAWIGQVHRAELPNGARVAVKIQYPRVAEALEADLRNAGTIVRLCEGDRPGAGP